MSRLTEQEERYLEDVLEAGRSLDRDTFEVMVEDGVPADDFISSITDYNVGEVLESLKEKGLVYTESVEETVHYNGSISAGSVEPIKWENTGFKDVERLYVYFTEDLKEV